MAWVPPLSFCEWMCESCAGVAVFSVKPGVALKKDLTDSLIGLFFIFTCLGLDGFTLASQVCAPV